MEREASLKALREHIRIVAAMKSALWPFLPPSLRSHCELANFRDSTLWFVADSPVWAARLRHASPQILHAARHRCKIGGAKLRVRAVPDSQVSSARTPKRLSKAAREHLSQAAATMDDEELARRLKELAERD